MKKQYLLVGGWGLKPGPKGISIFEYDSQTSDLTFNKLVCDRMCVGYMYYDDSRNVLYVADESERIDKGAAQGYIQPFKVGDDEVLKPLMGIHTLLPKPSACRLDLSGKFLLVCHHSGRGTVTRLIETKEGYSSEGIPDEAAFMSYSIAGNGEIKELVDVKRPVVGDIYSAHAISHEHCVEMDPSGNVFLVCDKGLDKISTYSVSSKGGQITSLFEEEVTSGWMPRLAAFHPKLPYVYVNFENAGVVGSYSYNKHTGELKETCMCEVASKGKGLGLAMAPDGRHLYVSLKDTKEIVTLSADNEGGLSEMERTDCGGDNPRSLFVTPDGRFLFCANTDSDMVTRFRIDECGIPQLIGMNTGIMAAANFALVGV